MSLTNHTKQALIAEAHTLHPIVIIGNEGLTRAVLLEIDRALYDHPLIKIRLPSSEKSEKLEIIQAISQELRAECLKMIGHICIFFRPSDKDKKKKEKAAKKPIKATKGRDRSKTPNKTKNTRAF